MTKKLERNFEGVWIGKEIWENQSLTLFEKCLLVEIKSLDVVDNAYGGCFASNGYFADFFSISETQVSIYISRLKEKGFITQKSFNGKIRVLNCIYQMNFEFSAFKKSKKQPLRKLKSSFKENLKAHNKMNNTINNTINYSYEDKKLAELLLELINNNVSTFKQPNMEKWSNEMNKITRIDKRTYEQVEIVIRWSQQDHFWQANILSPTKLRKQFDTLVAHVKRDRVFKKRNIVKL